MRAVALIAGNFLREQRWVLLALAVYSLGMSFALMLGETPEADDLAFFARQQGTLGLLFGLLLVSAAIHNDRRSRRLLLVLSKAVTRWQYLTALALASVTVSAGFILLAWIALQVVNDPLAASIATRMLLPFLPAALLAISIGICFATFTHPFFANVLTLAVLGASFAIGARLPAQAALLLPGAGLFLSGLAPRGGPLLPPVVAVLLQSAAVFVLTCRIFSRRDLGSNVE